ncbi:MAG: dihydroorotate dehydrogenase [Dehalococcoidia bacterium]|nr:dihydroorotate dehydrogenase [Dehalococcoidia bacterium]
MPAIDLSLTLPEGHPRALQLHNPVMIASGTFGADGYGDGLPPTANFQGLGAVVAKTTTLLPRAGNPQPRMAQGWGWMLNSIGLANPGIDAVLRDKAPQWATWRVPVVLSIAGERASDFAQLASMIEGVPGVAAIEVNVSCPNIEGGLEFAQSRDLAAEVTARVKERTTLPVIVKLSPNVTDIVAVARAVEDAGADALTLVNTLIGMTIDQDTARPVLGAKRGGVSGPALKPVALAAVFRVYEAVRVPIIGVGGVTTGEDALEFLMAGATAVQVGTANFADPQASWQVLRDLTGLLRRRRVAALCECVGIAHDSPAKTRPAPATIPATLR